MDIDVDDVTGLKVLAGRGDAMADDLVAAHAHRRREAVVAQLARRAALACRVLAHPAVDVRSRLACGEAAAHQREGAGGRLGGVAEVGNLSTVEERWDGGHGANEGAPRRERASASSATPGTSSPEWTRPSTRSRHTGREASAAESRATRPGALRPAAEPPACAPQSTGEGSTSTTFRQAPPRNLSHSTTASTARYATSHSIATTSPPPRRVTVK